MLLSYNDLRHFAIEATDGRKGHAEDFYFDDESWRIRYLVTEFGFLFNRQQGLIKSTLLSQPDLENRTVPVLLTQDQLEESESPDAHPPVHEQRERAVRQRRIDHWPPLMLGVPGAAYTPMIAENQLLGPPDPDSGTDEAPEVLDDIHLRSMSEVVGYSFGARDGQIGSVLDFLLDPNGWKIRYIAADTGTWLPGRQVVIRPDWISAVVWADRRIVLDQAKEALEQAPELSEIDELERSDAPLAVAPYGAYGGFPM